MATSTLEFVAVDGLTLTAELYAGGSDVLVTSVACTERTNNKAVYTASLVDVATGTYRVRIRNASNQTIVQDWLYHLNQAITEFPEGGAPRGEPGQMDPPVNAPESVKLGFLYKFWRNKKEQTAAQLSLYDDAGTTVDQKAAVADDGATTTVNEIGTGP